MYIYIYIYIYIDSGAYAYLKVKTLFTIKLQDELFKLTIGSRM